MTRFRFGKTPLATLLVLALPAAAAWAQEINGLYGEYFNSGDWTGPVVETRLGEGPIDFFYPKPPGTPSTDDPATNGTGGPQGAVFGTKTDNFSTIWRGKVESPMGTAGFLKFRVTSDDLARLYINGSQVIAISVNTRESGNIAVTANQRLDLVLMHQEWGGLAYIHLEWAYGTAVDPTNWELVPQNRLYSPMAVATVPTPQASPNGGPVPLGGSVNVTLSITPPDNTNTVIYYSTNGTNPDIIYRTPPPAGVSLYTTGPIVINQYGIIRARAYTISGPNAGLVSPLFISNVFSADFPAAVPPTGTTEPGLYFRFYDLPGLGVLPNFDGLIPEIRGGMPTFGIQFPSTTSRPKGDQFGLVHTGYFEVPAGEGGGWRFYLRSDDGSKLFIDGVEVVDNDGLHGTNGFPGKEGGPITLQAGIHTIRVEMFENGGGEELLVNYLSPSRALAGDPPQPIPADKLSRDPITATPVVSPNGGNFGESVTVTMTCATPDSFLYWTTDGSPPNPYGPIQHAGSGPSGSTITLHRDSVLRVLATAPFQNPSEIKRANFWRSPLLLTAQANALAPRELLVTFDKSIDAAGLADLNNFVVSGAVVNSASLVSKAGLGVLRAHWKMDEGAAIPPLPLDDSTSFLNHGIDQPDTQVTNVVTGGVSTYNYYLPFSDNLAAPLLGANSASRYFSFFDDIVRVESSPSLQFGHSSFTFAFWMRPNGGRVARRIINKWDPGTAANSYADRKGWMLDLNNPGEGIVRFFMRDAGGREVRAEVYMDPPDNVWQHIAVRVDREKGRVYFFRDGVHWGNRAMSSNVLDPDNAAPLFIGNIAQPIAPVEFFIGNLDDFRIYSTGLSDGEIHGLASGGDQVSTMVRLTTAADLPASGTVLVRNLKAVGTNTVAIPASGYTVPFTVQTTGTVLQENYTGITGSVIPNLTLDGSYPAGSSTIQPRTTLQMIDPGGATDTNSFGVRMRGYFVPPSDSATWRFALNSDNYGQFWLSPDENPANKVLVSKVVGSAALALPVIEYNKAGVSFQSGDINLIQGKRYYFEALLKENSGSDNLAVAASPAGTTIADNTLPLSAVAQLIPMRDPLVVLRHPHSKVLPLGGSVTFDAVIGGTGRLTYQWYKNGTTPVGTGRTFTIASAVVADGGFYHLQVTNPDTFETVSTQQARLVVYSTASPPTVTGSPNPNPNTGSAGGGNTVTITGTNFIDGATFVSFGVNYGTLDTVSPAGDWLTVVVPPGPVGLVSVRVTTPLGFATLSSAYTYEIAPTVTSVSTALANGYSSGLTAGTTGVIVRGTGFGVGTTISFGGIFSTNVTFVSATQLTVDVPQAAPLTFGPVDVQVFNGALNSAPLVGGWSYFDAPTLTQISPNSGPAAGGNQVTLVGTNFAPGIMVVTFQGLGNATIAVQPTGPAYDSMQVTVPANAVGGGVNVFVTNPAIASSSGNQVYTYYVPPTATAPITTDNAPFNAASGPLAGGTLVTINGSGFISGQTTVHFISAGGTVDVLPPNVNVISGTQITFNAPAGLATGTVNVTVETPGGTTNALSYTYYATPTITPGGIAAMLAPFNTADGPLAPTSVMIQGTGFVSGSTVVNFGAAVGTGVIVNPTGTSLTVTTPAGVAAGTGSVSISIQTPGGTSTVLPNAYTYHDPPVMGTLSPLNGPTNGSIGFTITGAQNFPNNLTLITFGGVSVTDVDASVDPTTGTVPQHTSGAANVVVTTPGGSTAPITFTYNAGPFINSISPAGGTTGATSPPNTTIFGNGFGPASTVSFGVAGPGTVVSINLAGTQIIVTPPASGTVQTVDVSVTSGGQTFTLAGGYSYVTTPVITSLSITQGPVNGSQQLTITGTGFVPGSTTVTFGGAMATVGTITATTIAITTPGHAAGVNLPVIVRTLGQFDSAPSPYTYWGLPTVASVVPTRGPTNGNQTITLTGTNFVDLFTEVTIGGTPATNIAVGSGGTTLTCRTPNHAPGVATITVTTFNPPGQSGSLFGMYTFVDSATSIDLSLTLGVDNPTPNVGDDVTLTLTIDNTGAVAGSGISVNVPLPAGLTLVSALPSVGTYVGGVWTVGNVAVAGNASLTIVATMTSSAALTVVAEVAAATQADSDSIPNNGLAYEDDRATVQISTILTITTPLALPDGTSGAVYSQGFSATGGTPPLTWALVSSTPAFPFALNTSTGVISGTAPTVAGPLPTTYSFTIRVTDAIGATTTRGLFTIDINPPAAGNVTVNSTPTPAGGMVGVAYTHTFSASGATAPYTWTLTGGVLPGGLSLNATSGAVAGTPTAAGTFNFQLTATPASGTAGVRSFSITIVSNPVAFVTAAGPLAGGTVGSPYSQLVEVSGGVGSTFTWSLAAGTLPNGVAPPAGTGRTATLSGTPTTAGTFNFDLRAADDGQPGLNVTRAFSITIVATGSPTPFSVTTTVLPSGTQGQLYTGPGAQLTGTGGTTPYTWSILTGNLPAGLTLNTAGAIIGTPNESGSFSITFQGNDAGTGVDTVDLTIDIASIPLVTSMALPGAVRNTGYFAQLLVTGGSGSITWSSTALPTGLVLDPASGAISGIPTDVGGGYGFTATATDGAGASDGQAFLIVITDPGSGFAISTTSLPSGFDGVPYSFTLQTVGATGAVTWTAAGLPAWAAFDVNTGTISGIPTAGTSTPSFSASDGTPAVAGPFTLQIDAALAVATTALPGSDPGIAYAAQLASSGAVAPETWSILSGSLPGGLSMSTAGTITGTTTTTGIFVFTVQVQDGLGRSAQRPLSILVALGASITPDSGSSGKNCSMAAAEPGMSILPFAALLLLGAFALRKRNLA